MSSKANISHDLIAEQLTPWVKTVLISLLAGIIFWMPLPFIASQQPLNRWIGFTGSFIAFIGTCFALLLLRRGSLYTALLTASIGVIIGCSTLLFGWGLSAGAGVLSGFAMSMILAALVSNRRELFFVTALCMVLVTLIAILEEPPYQLAGFASLGPSRPIIIVGSFILANSVLAVFVHQFSQSLRSSLAAALNRQRELEQNRAQLEEQVRERKKAQEQIVAAREEERRRLRRDLHDGLGPALATLVVQFEAARELLADDPASADELLADMTTQTQAAISDIRRLVYALRPPALDDLGLVGALRAYVTRYNHTSIHFEIVAPEHMSSLPAAVEVATFRIVQEALTNVIRHSQASMCEAKLTIVGMGEYQALAVEIWDDGIGISPAQQVGVGLMSMRERAAEIGGTCCVERASGGGTRVSVFLPLDPLEEMEHSSSQLSHNM